MAERTFSLLLSQMSLETHMHDETVLNGFNNNLYHYTSSAGLIGILQSNRLWATSAVFLNDSKELKFGIDLINSYLEEIKAERTNALERQVIEALSSVFKKYPCGSELDTYIACFSENDDTLSQWKGFSNQGNGFSIGFDSRQFVFNYRSSPYVFVTIKKVIYNYKMQRELIRNEIQKYLDLARIQNIDLSRDDVALSDFTSSLSYNLMCFSKMFKDETFEEEKEWRAITVDLSKIQEPGKECPTIKYRTDGNIIPYLELNLSPKHSPNKSNKLPIKEIIIGPKIDFERNKMSILKLLNETGFEDVMIRKSRITLR